ncbi:hypothetical protein BDB01DRAFT_800818 [Pilobolus umbonatus]|nr:hypothetical protein BDB01DRAFT_800818 [Pilobolus umbonatus]
MNYIKSLLICFFLTFLSLQAYAITFLAASSTLTDDGAPVSSGPIFFSDSKPLMTFRPSCFSGKNRSTAYLVAKIKKRCDNTIKRIVSPFNTAVTTVKFVVDKWTSHRPGKIYFSQDENVLHYSQRTIDKYPTQKSNSLVSEIQTITKTASSTILNPWVKMKVMAETITGIPKNKLTGTADVETIATSATIGPGTVFPLTPAFAAVTTTVPVATDVIYGPPSTSSSQLDTAVTDTRSLSSITTTTLIPSPIKVTFYDYFTIQQGYHMYHLQMNGGREEGVAG